MTLQDGASGGAPRWGGSFDAVMLDDCNFHESVSLDRFEAERMLELVPPTASLRSCSTGPRLWSASMWLWAASVSHSC